MNADAIRWFLENVFPLILEKKPNATLDIVGSNPSQKLLDRLSERVRVTGFVPDIRPYLAQASVAVCPVQLAVGTQNKIIEAMAMGTPIVSTTYGCTGLAIKDGRDLLMATGPVEFARKVVEIFDDRQLAEQLSRNGRKYVEKYHDWDSIVGDLEAIYVQTASSWREEA